MENKETFNYTYSSMEQEEIKNIRQKYVTPTEDGMARLRRLDAGVTQKATIFALIAGIIGALIMGFGMSLAMTNLYAFLGLSQGIAMAIGIIVGLIGMACEGMAYPIYNCVLKKERAKIAPEIIRLTDELMR